MPYGEAMTQRDDFWIRALFEALALPAGRRILEVRAGGFATELKQDESPVTAADREAEQIILEGLRRELPDIPVVAEEEAAGGAEYGPTPREFILVDPLDGTREFVNGNGDFTVNIALIRDGAPVVGVVYAPVSRKLYAGAQGRAELVVSSEDHHALGRQPIRTRAVPQNPVIVASRSHRTPETDAFIARYPGADLVSVGSSLKFCLLAAGEADIYPRCGPTMQWDTAAGDAVLRAAGGMTTTFEGAPLVYGFVQAEKPFLSPHFLAVGRAQTG